MTEEGKKERKANAVEARREFLKKSAYAACATPVIVSMLVEKAEAGRPPKPSGNNNTAAPQTPPGGPQ